MIELDTDLSVLFESVRTSSMSESGLGVKLLLDNEVHVLAVFIETTDARKHNVGTALPAHRKPAARVRERHGTGHEARLNGGQGVLDTAHHARANRLLEKGADVEADIQRVAGE